jgi:purine-nucleoside phosphorylase
MSIHISANSEDIAKNVLLAGDPLRAKYIADNFLADALLVSQTRNILYYTGNYKGQQVTVGASGMGCASIGIYSYELFTEFNVDCIIRIGTCGAYTTNLNLFDVLNVKLAASESTYAKYAWGIESDAIAYHGNAFQQINETAARLDIPLQTCAVHSSDIFYRKDSAMPEIATANNCRAVEMEAFALFANAQYLNKTAATLLTVSDIIPTHEQITADQRQIALLPMINLALDTIVKL